MEMTINDAVLRYNLLSVAKFNDGEYFLPRELKIKLIRFKLNLERVKDDFISFQEKAMEEIKTEEYNNLFNKENRTEEDNKLLDSIAETLNEELLKLINNKTQEMVTVTGFDYITDDEFNDFLSVNVENAPVINGTPLDADTYIELCYKNFIK